MPDVFEERRLGALRRRRERNNLQREKKKRPYLQKRRRFPLKEDISIAAEFIANRGISGMRQGNIGR